MALGRPEHNALLITNGLVEECVTCWFTRIESRGGSNATCPLQEASNKVTNGASQTDPHQLSWNGGGVLPITNGSFFVGGGATLNSITTRGDLRDPA